MIERQIESPMPMPLDLVVKKVVNSRSALSAENPTPQSVKQEYFADGIVEDILTGLSRIKWLFVIARNSSFVYKGQGVDIKRVGRELGVRYVLEGSIRKTGTRDGIRRAGLRGPRNMLRTPQISAVRHSTGSKRPSAQP